MFAFGYDLVALSVIFSWEAPIAKRIALQVKANSDVWCGGPGMFALKSWWERNTALPMHQGLDPRFERQCGDYKMTFASRGCPVNCWFCIVPKLEGTEFALDWDFQPTPVLCDNNLSALPDDFQDHIIRRYRETGTPLLDANSGFEPLTFTEDTRRRWEPILRGPWRFAYDHMGETEQVKTMMDILRDVRPGRKRVYVLIGNEPFEACYERAQKVIEWGGEPFCQAFIPLNSLTGVPKARHDWTVQKLKDFMRYYNKFLWRNIKLSEYSPRRFSPSLFIQEG